ncbi:MAG: hypothetical protein QOK84_02675, partial [Nitrososphaeraceae archaeon]|nr:hypothetical protein [Nitrososphaeraceae archaeon]
VEDGSGSADGDDGGSGGGSTGSNDNRFECTNNLVEPNTGDAFSPIPYYPTGNNISLPTNPFFFYFTTDLRNISSCL